MVINAGAAGARGAGGRRGSGVVFQVVCVTVIKLVAGPLPLMLEPYRPIDDRRLTELQRDSPERRVQQMLDRLDAGEIR